MNKKIMAFGIMGIFLLAGVSALIITSNQLSEWSDQDILNAMVATFAFEKEGFDMDDQYFYQYYTVATLEPTIGEQGNYTVKTISLKGVVRFDDYFKCLEENSETFCVNALITGQGFSYTEGNETYTVQSINQQVISQGLREFEKVKSFRDESIESVMALSNNTIGGLSF